MRDIQLERFIKQACEEPAQESKIVVTMGRIVDWLRHGSADWVPSQPEIAEQLTDLADEYQIAAALEAFAEWELHRDYHDGGAEALALFREVATDALDDDWPNVALYSHTIAAELARELSADEDLNAIAAQLYPEFVEQWPDLSPNTRSEILDATGYIASGLDDERLAEVIAALDDTARAAYEAHEFSFERQLLDELLDLSDDETISTEELQDRLVTSFERQLDVEERTGAHEAHILQQALTRCSEFVGFAQQNEWKAALRRAHRDSIDNLAEFSYEPSDEEVDELDEAIDDIIEEAAQVAAERSRVAAIYFLLAVPIFLPRIEPRDEDVSGMSITDVLPRMNLTREGDSIPERDDSNRRGQYGIRVQFRDRVLTQCLERAFERRIVTEGDLYLFLWSINGLSAADVAYLTDVIIAHFDGRYGDALHVGVARLEGAIASMLQNEGIETASRKDGYQTPTPLPGLLGRLEEGGVDTDLVEYLRYKYADISGRQLRNKLAHGRAPYQWAAWNLSLVLLYDILLTVGWLEDDLRYYAE